MSCGTSRWSAIVAVLALGCALGLTAGCVGDAGSPHSGALAFVPEGRAYRVWYMSPPWAFVSAAREHAQLDIPTFPNPNAPRSLLGALTVLTVDVVGQAPGDALAARVAAGLADVTRDDHLLFGPRVVALAQGVSGIEAAWGGPLHTMRVAVARLPDTRTIVLSFESLVSIENDPDVTGMIGQVETVTVGP